MKLEISGKFHALDELYARDLNRNVAVVNDFVHDKDGYLIEN